MSRKDLAMWVPDQAGVTRRRLAGPGVLVTLLTLTWISFYLHGQGLPQEPGPEDGLGLKLESVSTEPGAEFSLPIYLSGNESVSSITFNITLPPTLLFVRAEASLRALQPITDIFEAQSEAGEDGSSVVSLEIANSDREKAIPVGSLGNLFFIAGSELKPGELLELPLQDVVLSGSGGEIEGSSNRGAHVSISDPSEAPLTACFFYMH